jgi:HlyD family secretion protein
VREGACRALIDLNRTQVKSQGRHLNLSSGLQASAEIHLGTWSVLEYFLSPMQKVVHEAGRER